MKPGMYNASSLPYFIYTISVGHSEFVITAPTLVRMSPFFVSLAFHSPSSYITLPSIHTYFFYRIYQFYNTNTPLPLSDVMTYTDQFLRTSDFLLTDEFKLHVQMAAYTNFFSNSFSSEMVFYHFKLATTYNAKYILERVSQCFAAHIHEIKNSQYFLELNTEELCLLIRNLPTYTHPFYKFHLLEAIAFYVLCDKSRHSHILSLLQQSKLIDTKNLQLNDVTPKRHKTLKPHIQYHHFLWFCTKRNLHDNDVVTLV